MKGIIFIVLFAFCINGFKSWTIPKPYVFIIDGTPVKRGDYPFVVSIQKHDEHICGGSIITPTTVLSAAHCFFMNPDYRNMEIIAGIVDLESYKMRQERRISDNIKIHPKYRNSHVYDIALFKVDRPFVFNRYVNSIGLEAWYSPYPRDGTVAGWGRTAEDEDYSQSSILLQASVRILSHNDCVDYYGDDVEKGLLCSLPCCSHEDACQGDSGGPLIYENTLVGIISAGNGCGSKTRPSVYTKVFSFIDWINQNSNYLL